MQKAENSSLLHGNFPAVNTQPPAAASGAAEPIAVGDEAKTRLYPARHTRRDFIRKLACVPALLPRVSGWLPHLATGPLDDPTLALVARRTLPPPLSPQAPPDLLSFEEILELYREAVPPSALREKLTLLLSTPFVSNRAIEAGVRPLKPVAGPLGRTLRVAQWNINRGLEFDAIRMALSDAKGFTGQAQSDHPVTWSEHARRIREQLAILQSADVIVLNEVDWGVNRTGFRNVADELAHALGMNYAFGAEFVEVDPLTMGLDQRHLDPDLRRSCARAGDSKHDAEERARAVMKPDPSRYRGLHGTAIFSRYRLENVRLIPFPTEGYDWYRDEKRAGVAGRTESLIGLVTFDEPLIRQVRRGGRMMLFAELRDADLPCGCVTVVATHLEDRTAPETRRRQMQDLLGLIGEIDHPVIIAGDMNTTTHVGMPISVTHALNQTIRSPGTWAARGFFEAVERLTPWGWTYSLADDALAFAHRFNDPTNASVPLFMPNPEEKLFSVVEEFRFADGCCFDFRGDRERSANHRRGKLANSNERGGKGFLPTREMARTYGPLGQYKIDWIFVRPQTLNHPCDDGQSYRFSPHFGRTLLELNHALCRPMSDHSPITVDLPLDEAAAGAGATNQA